MNFYTDIIKRAYYITKTRPLLWLFGMFLVGTFNANLFRFRNSFPETKYFNIDVYGMLWYFERHPGVLALLSASILVVAIGSLLLTNLSRILLLLSAQSALGTNEPAFAKQLKLGLKYLWPIIQISLFTTMFMLGAVAVLVAPLMVEDPILQAALWGLGLIIFFPLVFTISSVNIFTGMYVVLHNLPVKKAFNAGTDFFIYNWTDLLGLTLVLLVIYLAGYSLVQSVWFLFKLLPNFGLPSMPALGALHFLRVFIIIKALGAVCLWILLGALNAFVNIVLLLFFNNRVKKIKSDAPEQVTEPAYNILS